MKPKDLSLEDIAIGDFVSFDRTFSEKDQKAFARLSGNTNPLHTDERYTQTTKFKHRLVYGMHVAIVCSTLVGMYLPGKRCLCLRQTLSFKKPVFVDETLKISGTVKTKSLSTGILDILISVTREKEEVMTGMMTVQVLS